MSTFNESLTEIVSLRAEVARLTAQLAMAECNDERADLKLEVAQMTEQVFTALEALAAEKAAHAATFATLEASRTLLVAETEAHAATREWMEAFRRDSAVTADYEDQRNAARAERDALREELETALGMGLCSAHRTPDVSCATCNQVQSALAATERAFDASQRDLGEMLLRAEAAEARVASLEPAMYAALQGRDALRTRLATSGAREARMAKLLLEIRADSACNCGDSWTSRGRHQPECRAYWLASIDAALTENPKWK